MPLFSRKPSKEAALQKIYGEAYQSSLQSILKESSFDFRGSLESWKQTLDCITSGMAMLDGSPPKTGQEKSLLASIMDTERQCHDRIGALEAMLFNDRGAASTPTTYTNHNTSPYTTHSSNPSAVNVSYESLSEKRKPQRVAVGSRGPSADQIKSNTGSTESLRSGISNSRYQASDQTPTLVSASAVNLHSKADAKSPALDFTDKFPGKMPKVSDMPYKMYTQKPQKSFGKSGFPTKSVPLLASELAITKKQPVIPNQSTPELARQQATPKSAVQLPKAQSQSGQQPQSLHRSSLDYPQPAPSNHGHSMLSTLRSRLPLKSRSRGSQHHNSSNSSRSMTRSPSPLTSSESLSSPKHDTSVKHNNTARTAAKLTANQPPGSERRVASHPRPSVSSKAEAPKAEDQFSGFEGVFRHEEPEASRPVENSAPPEPEPPKPSPPPPKVTPSHTPQQAPSKSPQFQVAYEKVSTFSGRTVYRPRVVRSAQSASSIPHSSRNSSGPSNRTSKRTNEAPIPVLAEGQPKSEKDPEPSEMSDWEAMVKDKIKGLRGVDKNAAQQIINEVVLKGDKVTWDDIAGLEKAKASLKETVVYPFLRPDLFQGLREPVLGMLLFGPPGTGKTMLARAVAAESKSTFFSISASSLTSKYMGESEKLVRALFQMAKALAPSIIFVDEIDSILTQRADSGEHEASRRIKNEFLVQWSDLQAAAAGKTDDDAKVRRVLVLGATNLPWAIDEAARRRFVRRQYIPLPEDYTRRVHLEKLLSHQKHGISETDIDKLVKLTDGYSGSDLTALAKDAAMGPLRSLGDALLTTAPDQIRPMGMSDFVESMQSIRPSVSPEGLRAFEQWADLYGSSGA